MAVVIQKEVQLVNVGEYTQTVVLALTTDDIKAILTYLQSVYGATYFQIGFDSTNNTFFGTQKV